MKATPKPYVLIVTGEGPTCMFELWADDRLFVIANEHPALRRLADVTPHEKATSARYGSNPRWDAAEVESELREQLDAAVAAVAESDAGLIPSYIPVHLPYESMYPVSADDESDSADDD